MVELSEKREARQDKLRRKDERRARWIIVALAALVAGVILLILAVFLVRSTQLETRHNTLRQAETTALVQRTLDALIECTVPSTATERNACWERSQATTASAVFDVICAFRPELLQPRTAQFCATRQVQPPSP